MTIFEKESIILYYIALQMLPSLYQIKQFITLGRKSINISCDVKSNPPASVHWRREKLVLPAKNTTNLKTYSTGRKIILEVSLHYISTNCIILAVIYYFRIYLNILIYKLLFIILSTMCHIYLIVYIYL